MDHAQLTW